MQSHYPEQFVRDMGCTEQEWLTWLQAALPDHDWPQAHGQARVSLDEGQGVLHLQWTPMPPRQIALMRIPRLQVAFRFEGLSDEGRTRFMRRFDLMTQRGGG